MIFTVSRDEIIGQSYARLRTTSSTRRHSKSLSDTEGYQQYTAISSSPKQHRPRSAELSHPRSHRGLISASRFNPAGCRTLSSLTCFPYLKTTFSAQPFSAKSIINRVISAITSVPLTVIDFCLTFQTPNDTPDRLSSHVTQSRHFRGIKPTISNFCELPSTDTLIQRHLPCLVP